MRTADAPLSKEEQDRLAELRQKDKLSKKEQDELDALDARALAGGQQSQAQHGDRPPVGEAIGPALNADEQRRMEELRAKRAELSMAQPMPDEEAAELDALERRSVPQAASITDQVQRDLSPNRPVAPVGEVAKEDANRLRDLRVAAERGMLSEAERGEMASLSLAESEYAGHVTPPGSEEAEVEDIADELVFLIEQMVSLTPRFRILEPRLRALRQRLNEERTGVRSPPIRPSDMQPQQPGPNP